MYPAKACANPIILSCLNNLFKYEILNRPKKFLCGLRAAIFGMEYLGHSKMYPAKFCENPLILACLNNLVKFENLKGPQKFLCGLRATIFCMVYKWHPQMYPVKFYRNPSIKTCPNNLINFEAKTPPFSGVRVGHTSTHDMYFFIQKMKVHDLRMSNVQKKIFPFFP